MANHENKWLRNVFRHYIQYLYHRRRISGETMAWILEVVPSRSYRLDVRPYPFEPSDVLRTVEHLRRSHRLYYAIYRVMLESGARLSHTTNARKTGGLKRESKYRGQASSLGG